MDSPAGRKDGRRIITWMGLVVALIGALGFVWLARPMLFAGIAKLWMVSDSLNQADAIVVLGGGLDVRPVAAADLYKRGMAPRVAVGFSEFDQGQDASLNRDMLL